jgi:4-hydroxy-3-polyprenylbenzoate decarboxylase
MENAKKIWEELGLPKLKPESPWFGYSLGEWNQEFDAMAARATAGNYFDNAESLEQRRRSDVRMNTEVRRAPPQQPKSRPKRP